MSREYWLQKVNRVLRKRNRELAEIRRDDPRWMELGDYYLVSTKTRRIVRKRIDISQTGLAPWVTAD
jgi:recombinational DNA repair ATPase RecF